MRTGIHDLHMHATLAAEKEPLHAVAVNVFSQCGLTCTVTEVQITLPESCHYVPTERSQQGLH